MVIDGLCLIGESINDSVPSTAKLFEANDLDGLMALVKKQDERGAAYIDVNVGRRPAEFMARMVKMIQEVTAKPLSIDTPDYDIAKAGLEAYDRERTGGRIPVFNSISPLRLKIFELYEICPFRPLLMASERLNENGEGVPCRSPEEIVESAKYLLKAARECGHNIPRDDCIIDPGIAPIGTDTEGITKRLLEALRLMQADPEFEGAHRSVGLSNFTVMLPPKRANGEPVKSALESAFLTKAIPLGLDMIIGSVTRKYRLLPPEHDAMVCLEEFLQMDDFDGLMRVREFYS